MGSWEKELLQTVEYKPIVFLRFVDDIFGIWTHGEEQLIKFQEKANAIHPRIQVDLTHSKDKIDFLDVTVSIDSGNSLTTSIFEKPSDTHMYLHKSSDHPETTKRAVPYGLGIRAKRICSSEEDYKDQRQKIIHNVSLRGILTKEVHEILQKVDYLKRRDLLDYRKNRKKNDRVPLV